METVRWLVVSFTLVALISPSAALSNADVTGDWISTFSFGSFEEEMTANVQQIGNNIIGSYLMEDSPSGDGYGGIIFGTIEGGKIKAFYLATISANGGDPLTSITFTDGRLVNNDKIEGEYYYRDSDLSVQSGPYEAERV